MRPDWYTNLNFKPAYKYLNKWGRNEILKQDFVEKVIFFAFDALRLMVYT